MRVGRRRAMTETKRKWMLTRSPKTAARSQQKRRCIGRVSHERAEPFVFLVLTLRRGTNGQLSLATPPRASAKGGGVTIGREKPPPPSSLYDSTRRLTFHRVEYRIELQTRATGAREHASPISPRLHCFPILPETRGASEKVAMTNHGADRFPPREPTSRVPR